MEKIPAKRLKCIECGADATSFHPSFLMPGVPILCLGHHDFNTSEYYPSHCEIAWTCRRIELAEDDSTWRYCLGACGKQFFSKSKANRICEKCSEASHEE